MPRSLASQLSKLLEILHRQAVSSQMEHGVLQGAGMSVTQNESITIDPGWVLARVVHDFGPQQVSHGSTSHGSAGVTAVGRLRLVGRDAADRVDAGLLEGKLGHGNED